MDARGRVIAGALAGALAVAAVIGAFLFCLGCWGAIRLPYWRWNVTPSEVYLTDVAERAQPLIDAIGQYQEDYGAPPSRLAELIPDYMEAIPEVFAGLDYHYDTDRHCITHHAWYDLGPTPDTGGPIHRTWFDEGGYSHSIVLFRMDRDGVVRRALVDREPNRLDSIEFDEGAWRADPAARITMARDMLRTLKPKGRSFDELEAVLGPPDGSSSIISDCWSIVIYLNEFIGDIDADTFEYHPDPKHRRYGRRVGDWVWHRN